MVHVRKIAKIGVFSIFYKKMKKNIFGEIFFFSSIHYKISFHLICHMVHVIKSPKLAILVLKTFFSLKKLKKKNFEKSKKVVLDIPETRLVSKFGAIRLKITLFSKEELHFNQFLEFKNNLKGVLDILETLLVSNFGVIRLKITPFSKEKTLFLANFRGFLFKK